MSTESTDAAATSRAAPLARALRGVAAWSRSVDRALRQPLPLRDVARELAPLLLPLTFLPWLYYCCLHYASGTVWRDTPMYTYPAWCVLHGERLYSTIALPDGPFAVLLHTAMLLVGGVAPWKWRVFDVWFHMLTGGAIGAVLAPRAARFGVLRRVTWALVGAAVWLTGLMAFDFAASTQREAYYNGLGMLGLALVYTSAECSRRRAAWMVSIGAALAGVTFWGKQTAGIYAALVVLTALLLPPREGQARPWRLKWVVVGGAASTLVILAWVAAVGSLRGMWFWFFRYNLEYYRFHDIIPYEAILSLTYAKDAYWMAAVALVGGLTAIAAGVLPRHTLAFAIAPALELASAVAQHRGWRYHFIPAVFCAGVFFVLALAHAYGPHPEEPPRRVAQTIARILLGSFLAWSSVQTLSASPWMQRSEAHKADTATNDARTAAKVIDADTRPDDRVFLFADDPSVLLFAERRPATEFLVPWMIDLVKHVPRGGPLGVTPGQEAKVRVLEAMNQQHDCEEVLADPPPALVFLDNSVGYEKNIQQAFLGMCPALAPVLATRYREVPSGPYHIYVRDDRP